MVFSEIKRKTRGGVSVLLKAQDVKIDICVAFDIGDSQSGHLKPHEAKDFLSSISLRNVRNFPKNEALKDAVKAALDDNVDAALQCELWRHYQGVKQIAKQLEPASTESSNVFNVNFGYDPDSNINIPSGSNVAADTISFTSDTKDVVTFSWSSANRS